MGGAHGRNMSVKPRFNSAEKGLSRARTPLCLLRRTEVGVGAANEEKIGNILRSVGEVGGVRSSARTRAEPVEERAVLDDGRGVAESAEVARASGLPDPRLGAVCRKGRGIGGREQLGQVHEQRWQQR